MKVEHLEFLVEEPSMEAFLNEILPSIIQEHATYIIHVYQGKADLLSKIISRLKGYSRWLPPNARVIILVDRDNEDCFALKKYLEQASSDAGLVTRSSDRSKWQVVNRIAIEELEAWFFGEWVAVNLAYPKVPRNIPVQASYRQCDAIAGGTWEALERILKRAGYFNEGIRKIELAKTIGALFNYNRCGSKSFIVFMSAVKECLNDTINSRA